ncbi:ATP-binding protein [Streptococcus oralis]|uniref:ATP-binding protein n=1 Tax=Streptococcus oralis TaxID=1303 RepID=UPI0039C3A0E2
MPNKVEQVPITVAGNILSELSEKIPNNIIALNELIKNAYDACSPSVEITLDSESRLLTIRDYGIGMDTEGIKKLFHISSSDKKYGEIISYKDTERLTQGSKGLGFLSVFRFGKKVYWKTGKNSQIFEFGVDFENLKNEYNLPDHKLNIKISDQEFKGTQIVIDVDDYNLKSLKTTLANESSRKKILNSFVSSKVSDEGIKIDKEFIISLTLDDNKYSSDVNLDISHQGKKDHQLFRIKYSSKDKKINYYKNSILIYSSDFEYSFDDYIVDIDLMALDFGQGRGGKDKINLVFYKPQTTNDITPLVFINNNLFNNYHLFDTEIMASKRSSLVLRQLVGYISIKSSSPLMQFNSDRTQFSQNRLTDEITDFIKNLNEEIQRTGSSLRSEIKNINAFTQTKIPEEDIPVLKNNQKYIRQDFKLKDFIIFGKQGDKLKCTLFDREVLLDIIPKVKEINDLGTVEIWIGKDELSNEISNLHELIAESTEIRFNGDIVHEFNETQEGEWLIKKETDSTITSQNIILRKPVQPSIDVKQIDLLCNTDYDLNTIFTLYNSFGIEWDRIEPNIKANGNNTIRYDSRKGKIRFGRTGEQTITVSAKDKDTKLKYESDFTFRIKSPEEYEIKPEQLKQSLIRLPITKTPNFSSDIKVLINEINELFKTDYSIIPVISYRTLIELTVNDILNNIGEEKKTDLSKNYNKVISMAEDIIKDSRLDDKDKQILLGIYKSIQSQSEVNAFIAFLNLSVHNGARIITKEDVKTKTQEIQLLLVLLHLTSQ